MTQINTLEIPDELYVQIQGMALSQSRSINEQIVTLLQRALKSEMQRQTQARVLQDIHQARWIPPAAVPDSVAILREIRGYDE
jgi:antitoxin FitA